MAKSFFERRLNLSRSIVVQSANVFPSTRWSINIVRETTIEGSSSVLLSSVTKCLVIYDACLTIVLYSGRYLWERDDNEKEMKTRIYALELDAKSIRKTNTKLSSILSFAIFLQATLMYPPRQMKSRSRLFRLLSFIKLRLLYFLHKQTYFYRTR